MIRFLLLILLIISTNPSQTLAAPSTTVMDVTEQQGPISAHFNLSGRTLTQNATGIPQVSPVDQLEAHLTVTAPESYQVNLPTFAAATFGDFTLVERGKRTRMRVEQIETSTSWLIEPYKPGEYNLPPLTINASNQDGSSHTLTLVLPPLQIINLPPDTGFKLLPPRPKSTRPTWIIPTLCTLVGIASLVLLSQYIRSKKRPRPLSPKQRALKQLTELTGTSKEQTMDISRITRQFLDDNFGLHTSEKTYGEYAPFIKKHTKIENSTRLLQLLQSCDQNNYSNHPMEEAERATIKEEAKSTIGDCAEPLRPGEDSKTCGRW